MIEHLACEKDVVWCIDSYFNRELTHLMMDAVENSVLWEIPRDIMEELSDANGDIAYIYRRFFENSVVTILICRCQCGFGNRFASYAKRLTLGMMSLQSYHNVSQTFTI